MKSLRSSRGFTLVEVLVTLALVGLLAMVAAPAGKLIAVREKESELRTALRTLRTGLDAYKAAVDNGDIASTPGGSGYPPTLETLADGVDAVRKPGTPADAPKRRLVFLRQVPRDPFWQDVATPASGTWLLRGYASPPGDFAPGGDVFDLTSSHPGTGLDGTPYASW